MSKTMLGAHSLELHGDFCWHSAEHGTALDAGITTLIERLPDSQQDAIKNELDHFDSLATEKGISS